MGAFEEQTEKPREHLCYRHLCICLQMNVLLCLSFYYVCVWICIPALLFLYLTTDLCTSVSMHVFFVCDCMHAPPPPNATPTLCFLFPSAGLYELLAALPSQLQPHVSRPEDNTFLQDMFGEKSLHSLVKVKQNKHLCLFRFWLVVQQRCFSNFNNHLAIARALQLSKRKFISIMVEALEFFIKAYYQTRDFYIQRCRKSRCCKCSLTSYSHYVI